MEASSANTKHFSQLDQVVSAAMLVDLLLTLSRADVDEEFCGLADPSADSVNLHSGSHLYRLSAVETAPEDDPTLQGDNSTKNTGNPERNLDPTLGGG
jgi:hypothetical protein